MVTELREQGSRFYFHNLPFEAKEAAKAIGAHWDPDRRLWWIGKVKAAEAMALVSMVNNGGPGAVFAATRTTPGGPPPGYKQFPSKFDSICPLCNGRIENGTNVWWRAGEKARHAGTCPPVAPAQPAAPATPAPAAPRPAGAFTARYKGSCGNCAETIRPGDLCKKDTERGVVHAACPCGLPELPPAWEPLFELGTSSGRGSSGYHVGQVIRNSKFGTDDRPEYFFVLRCSAQYVREDGWSVGVNDESGYLYHALCREATPEESASPRQQRVDEQLRQTAKKALADTHREILLKQPHPSPLDSPVGPLTGETIYVSGRENVARGGGSWFVLASPHEHAYPGIWAVTNNGTDGDDWSRNNVVTGGAGAIGACHPWDEAMAEVIRGWAAQAGTL